MILNTIQSIIFQLYWQKYSIKYENLFRFFLFPKQKNKCDIDKSVSINK